MTIVSTPSIQKPPWPATAASLIAFFALFTTMKHPVALPILAVGLLATYGVSFRFGGQHWARWAIRVILFGFVIASSLSSTTEGGLWFYGQAGAVGELLAAELVVQCWRLNPTGGSYAAPMVLLSAFVFLAASDTYDPTWIRPLTPAYMLFAALSFQSFGAPAQRRARTSALALTTGAAVGALVVGSLLYGSIWTHRNLITRVFIHLFSTVEPQKGTDVSYQPTLTGAFNHEDDVQRVLRLAVPPGVPAPNHLRAGAFETYRGGGWLPSFLTRPMQSVSTAELQASAAGPRMHVESLSSMGMGLIFEPLNCAGLAPATGTGLQWNAQYGGPLESPGDPGEYDIILDPDAFHQGPFCIPLTPQERSRCLAVPPLDPRVRHLALQIAGKATPEQAVEKVSAYLQSHFTYSLVNHPDIGDPVSDFLLREHTGHCQYFASAAVILLRYLGVPSRYVNGYYVHEQEEPGFMVVRQRDAHAWTECWIDGKGWITVDTTPASGMPSELYPPISRWQALQERLQDAVRAASHWLRELSWKKLGSAAVCAGVLLLLARQISRLPRRRRAAPLPGRLPASSELGQLAAGFEGFLNRRKIPCPLGRTWKEHLDQMLNEPPAAALDSDLLAASAFVDRYNVARFSGCSAEEIHDLRRQLENLHAPDAVPSASHTEPSHAPAGQTRKHEP